MGAKGTILVIDDSSTIRRLANLVLQDEGYTVHTAEDGEEGLALAAEISPSLILVDFVMPKMNGYQFCVVAKENPALKEIPIVLITSKGEEVGEEFTERFGVVDYLIKPFEPEELIAKVDEIVQVPQEPEAPAPEPQPLPLQEKREAPDNLDRMEQVLDGVLQRYLVRELPSLLQKSIVDVFKHEGVVKSSAISLSGDFSAFSLFDIFQLLDASRPTGRLSVYSPSLSTEIYVDRGNIVYVSSSRHGGGILSPELLQERKNIPREAFDEAYREWKKQGVPLLVTLERKGWLTEEDILSLVRDQIDDMLCATMAMTDGRFYFEKTPLPDAVATSRVSFPPTTLMVRAARRLEGGQGAAGQQPDPETVVTRLVSDALLDAAGLTENERTVALQADGRRSIGDLTSITGIDENEVQSILHLLMKVGILRENKGVAHV